MNQAPQLDTVGLCMTYTFKFLASITMPDPQTSDMRQIR